MTILFRENRRHGTDGRTEGRKYGLGATLNGSPLARVALSITFQYKVNERYARYVTDRQISQKRSISLVKIFRAKIMLTILVFV